MASAEECEVALGELASRLAGLDPNSRRRRAASGRVVSCTIPDLGVTFTGRLEGGRLLDIHRGTDPPAQLKLRVASDDLLALTGGRLSFPAAWATGRLRVDASIADLIRLRTLL